MNDSRSPEIAEDGDIHSFDDNEGSRAAAAVFVVRNGMQETGHE